MSNGAKIAIGCVSAFVVMVIVLGITIGVLTYRVTKPFMDMGVQAEQLSQLDQKYAFTEPDPDVGISVSRFDEFIVARKDLSDAIANNEQASEYIDLFKPTGNQNQGPQSVGDAFGMIGNMGVLFELLHDELDENQMSISEYAYYKDQLYWMIFHKALEGDQEYQDLWNEMEKANSYTETDWTVSKNDIITGTFDFADLHNINKMTAPTEEEYQLLESHEEYIKSKTDIIYLEMFAVQNNYQF